MTFDAAPVSQATPVSALSTQSSKLAPTSSVPSGSPDAGMTFDAQPVTTALTVPAVQSQPTQTQPSQPGLLDRLYETSGAKGLVNLGVQTVERPIDLYHQAVSAAQNGDWKNASEAALKLTGMVPDKDSPLVKAAQQIIMSPINQMEASYKANRAAGYNPVASATIGPNVVRGVRNVVQRVGQDARTGNYAGAVGDVLSEPLRSYSAGQVPLFGSALQQEGENLDNDLHGHNYGAVAGDVAGPLLTAGAGKVLGSLGDAGEAADAAQASETADAGVTKAAAKSGLLTRKFSLQAVQDALQNARADIQQGFSTDTQAIQDDWHQTVRDILASTAKDADVAPENATSLHDIAANLSDALKAKGKGWYREADEAIGGTRFQSYQDAVKNIKDAIREEVGLSPERDGQLQQRLADAQAGHEAAKETLAAKGIDPSIVDKAGSYWKQGSAVGDLSKHMQASIAGLRADLQGGADTVVESLSPAKLAARVNRMYNAGRLQQAIGEDGSSNLLTAIEDTKARLQGASNAMKQRVAAAQSAAARDTARVQTNITAAKYALGSLPGYELLKHLLF